MATRIRSRTGNDRLWTEAEFLALPETTQRMELLDGEVIREPGADWAHNDRMLRVAEQLRHWSRTRTPRPHVNVSAVDIRFGDGRILQPDVMLFLQPLPLPVRSPITVIPDLCVEVVSRNRTYDRVTKRQIYAEAGVREYWTVVKRLGFVERWTGERLMERMEICDRLVTPLLPGFELDVRALMVDE